MEKVLSEKNKQIRAQQKHYRELAKRRRVFYPSLFVRDSKTGRRVPYRRSKLGDTPAAQPQVIAIDEVSQLTDEVIQQIADENQPPVVVKVGTIGHDNSVLKDS